YAAESPYQLSYGWIRYPTDGGCNSVGNVADNAAWTAVHEYAEIATDPHIYLAIGVVGSGWFHNAESILEVTPREIADLCADYDTGNSSPSYTSTFGLTYALPYLWSDRAGNPGCVLQEGIEYRSRDITAPFNGKHTVQGDILAKYQSATCP